MDPPDPAPFLPQPLVRVLASLLLGALVVALVVQTRGLVLPPLDPTPPDASAPSDNGGLSDDRGVVVERPDFGAAFEAEGVAGTFALLDADTLHVYDPARAATRYLPASTFKVPNALFALEAGAVADTAETIAWDGVERFVPAWNRDHALGTALRASAVWFFQEVARRIGEAPMRAYVERAGYGNADIGGGVDRFWLVGDLRISALEQVAFLERLARGALPFSADHQDAVRGIMVVERGVLADGTPYALHAKTGWANAPEPDLGWWVGYVEHGAEAPGLYPFALNIDMPAGGDDAPKRVRVARRLLASEGLLPAR